MGYDGRVPKEESVTLVSILVPVFNEEEAVRTALLRVLNAPLPEGVRTEAVVVDDGSNDRSPEILQELADEYPSRVRIFRHPVNRGKGAAVRTALREAQGELAIIQDSDLEYDPAEYSKLLGPLLRGEADAVYGSRFLVSGERRVLYYWHSLANQLLTTLCNMASDLNLTDMGTGYKAFRTDLVRSIPLSSDRFGIDPELTIKLAKRQAAIFEVPINYYGRTYEDGKKVGLRDAVRAVGVILRCFVSSDIYTDSGARILDTLSSATRFNAWMADTVRPWLGGQVMEIGAGIGNMARHLSRGRRRYVATDIDDEHLARLGSRLRSRPNVEIARCNLCDAADFADFREAFDTVVCLNVLEHVPDAGAGLRNIHSVLKPGGRAIVLVPQDQKIYGTLDKVLGHYLRYSEEELCRRMTEAGFRIETTLHFNRVTKPGWYWNGRVLKRGHFSRFQLGIFDFMTPVWRRIDRYLPWGSVSVIGIGVKV